MCPEVLPLPSPSQRPPAPGWGLCAALWVLLMTLRCHQEVQGGIAMSLAMARRFAKDQSAREAGPLCERADRGQPPLQRAGEVRAEGPGQVVRCL